MREDKNENVPPKLTDRPRSVNANLPVEEANSPFINHRKCLSRRKVCLVCPECLQLQELYSHSSQ